MHQFTGELRIVKGLARILVHDDTIINGSLLVLDGDFIVKYRAGQKFKLTLEPIDDDELPPTRAFMSFDSESVTVELIRKNPPRSVTGTGATYKEAFAAAQREARGRWWMTPEPQPWNVPPLPDKQINEIFDPFT